MYFWYKIVTYLFYPFAPIYLFFRKVRKKEDPLRYKEKISKIEVNRGSGFLIWFHVASVGEAMSIIPIIENCIEDKKISRILLTSITLSSGKILYKKYGKNIKVTHQFLPLDVPIYIKKFLNHWKPSLSVFIDSEIWPNLILQTNSRKIPLVLLNARITKKTFERWKLLISFANKIFSKFDLCIASNKESENFLSTLGAKNIKNYGNLKYSNTSKSLNSNFDNIFLERIKNKKVLCLASTHYPEEKFCAEVHCEIKKKYSNILSIIIPRHINRVAKIKKDLLNLNLNVVLSSNLKSLNNATDIILVDSYGETLKFYNISKNVFIGKSLIKELRNDGGQNPIEAARLGCKIYHGPYVSNFVEIYEYLKKLGITKEIKDSNELSLSLVEEFKSDEAINHEVIEKIENYGQNIFNNVIVELKEYIK